MTTDAAAIAHLDWTAITCQNIGCQQPATRIAERHAIDYCNNNGHPFGNWVEILCNDCFRALIQAIQRKWLDGRLYSCLTCGTPIRELADVLRAVSPIA